MRSHPKATDSIISKSGHLKQLMSTGKKHQKILSQIKQIFESNLHDHSLSEHCVFAQLENNHLRLFTDSSIWASRFRFQTRALQQTLNKNGFQIKKIDVRVIPPSSIPSYQKPLEPPKKVNSETASNILETAESIEDPGLKSALQRLARSASKF